MGKSRVDWCIAREPKGGAWLVPIAAAMWALMLFVLSVARAEPTFPRILGMNIGAKNYADPTYQVELSRADVVVLGFYPRWRGPGGVTMQDAVRSIRKMNPKILIGQYTILSEVTDPKDQRYADSDLGEKIEEMGWWLRDASGARVQWTDKYNAWEVNITQWAEADPRGRRYPEWQAERNFRLYFAPVPEFAIWYFDNATSKPAIKQADWVRSGINQSASDPEIARAHRQGHLRNWRAASAKAPDRFLMANAADLSSAEFSGRLNGVFIEAAIGRSWSTERRDGWPAVLKRYRAAMAQTKPPHIVALNVWGDVADYKKMRYGLSTTLLDDGYFSYTDERRGYSSLPWFDEYDAELGQPLEPPPLSPWGGRVYRRAFEHGIVFVNAGNGAVTVNVGDGFRALSGSQQPEVNHGRSVSVITLSGKDGVILLRDGGK